MSHSVPLYDDSYIKSQALPAFFPMESKFNRLMQIQLKISMILLGLMLIPITVDILVRFFFNGSIIGVTELETYGLVVIGFFVVGFSTIERQHIQIDIFFESFSRTTQRRLILFAEIICLVGSGVLMYFTFIAGMETSETSATLRLPNNIFIFITSYGFLTIFISTLYKIFHAIRERLADGDYIGIILCFAFVLLLIALPFIYKFVGIKFSNLFIGSIGFLILLSLLMLRVPLGISMILVGGLGLFTIMRSPMAVQGALGELPFRQTSEFIFLAMPMFMLMGEMITMGGLSKDLFECANKWLGRMPGGLAVAAIGGCAGFGAVCGDSMATVLTMSSVALQPMLDKNYSPKIVTGALAAGGTLGILIPPSMGFIVYSMMTEESVGRLFIAGIIPGILLTSIFCGIVIIQAVRNPELAPRGDIYPLREKLFSLIGLIPIIVLFVVVVGGIMSGLFTPGEGGAVGAVCATIIAAIRRKLTYKGFMKALYNTAKMCGVIFILLIGVFSFGVFLTSSRLPSLLADWVVNMVLNKYIVLFAVIMIYIFLGCVMNIMPMMMLTLPSIYPSIQALGFDGIWFGVLTVIIMEMGMITPPIGLNVFTMRSVANTIPVSVIFKGVFPFFLGMCLCALLIIIFPQIALFLPNLLFQ